MSVKLLHAALRTIGLQTTEKAKKYLFSQQSLTRQLHQTGLKWKFKTYYIKMTSSISVIVYYTLYTIVTSFVYWY